MEGRCIRFAKVMAAFLAAVMATGSLAGCGGGEPAGQAEASVEYEDKTYGGLSFVLPIGWDLNGAHEEWMEYSGPDGGKCLVGAFLLENGYEAEPEEVVESFIEGFNTSKTVVVDGDLEPVDSGYPTFVAGVSGGYKGEEHAGKIKFLCSGGKLFAIVISFPKDEGDDLGEVVDKVIDSASVDEPAEIRFASKNDVDPKEAEDAEGGEAAAAEELGSYYAPTAGQSNALKLAKSYLDTMAFSHDGLVEQLEYEQFSHEDAVWAADSCGADWMAQAAAMAKDYLRVSAFSRGELIDQLLYSGFTREQAEHGADSVGL